MWAGIKRLGEDGGSIPDPMWHRERRSSDIYHQRGWISGTTLQGTGEEIIIGKAYECLRQRLVRYVIGYGWEKEIRRKQKTYLLTLRCTVDNTLQEAADFILCKETILTALIRECIMEKGDHKKASRFGAGASAGASADNSAGASDSEGDVASFSCSVGFSGVREWAARRGKEPWGVRYVSWSATAQRSVKHVLFISPTSESCNPAHGHNHAQFAAQQRREMVSSTSSQPKARFSRQSLARPGNMLGFLPLVVHNALPGSTQVWLLVRTTLIGASQRVVPLLPVVKSIAA